MKIGSPGTPATSLALAISGWLACACGSGATGTKYGAVIVEAPGLATGTPIYLASAAFSDVPRLLQAGEFTSLEFGIGEPDSCTKETTGGCQVYRCPGTIEVTPTQFVGFRSRSRSPSSTATRWDPPLLRRFRALRACP